MHKALGSSLFDLCIGLVIVANSITIGIETNMKAQGKTAKIFETVEVVFMVIYTTELVCRFFAHHLHCLRSGWVQFDLLLVSMSIITAIVDSVTDGLEGADEIDAIKVAGDACIPVSQH